jgi:hypothetical protein
LIDRTHSLIVDLDDDRALDPLAAGAKAAWLARARRSGLPALPGRVVLAEASEAAIQAGLEGIAQGGSGAARMATMAAGLNEVLESELAGLDLPWSRLVVRSSSRLEETGEWAGAFTSYLDLTPADLAKAISGCWASSFTVATLQRFQQRGRQPSPMAVIIQPFLSVATGGWAEVDGSRVVVESVEGSPAGLFAGQESGHRSLVNLATGTVEGYRTTVIDEAAQMAGRAHRALGATRLEWAYGEGGLSLLQLGRSPRRQPETLQGPARADPELIRLVRIVARFPGPLGMDLVLPWAVGLRDPAALDRIGPIRVDSDTEAIVGIEAAARPLAEAVWRERGSGRSGEVLAQLAGDPQGVSDELGALAEPGLEAAAQIVGLIRGLGESLAASGRLGHPDEVWFLSLTGLEALAAGRAGGAPLWIGPDRWEPLGAAVVSLAGHRSRGVPAGGGRGFGRGVLEGGSGDGSEVGPRRVIVAPRPVPDLAPLLWGAAGLVCLSGSPAAHLFESARSLGVAAVVAPGWDHRLLGEHPQAVAVDGWEGTVAVIDW